MGKLIQYFDEVKKSPKYKQCKEFVDKLEIDNENNSYIEHYINYWILYNYGFQKNEIDKLWLQDSNSNLIRRNKEKLYADTIFSVWGPFKRIIELISKEENLKEIYNKNVSDLLNLKNNINNIFTDKYKTIYNTLNEFAKNAMGIGNVIEYPHNSDVNKNPNKINFNIDRGLKFNDLFLISLSKCYDNNLFSVCFDSESNYKDVNDWISTQKLNCFYEDGHIINIKNKKNNIIQDETSDSWKFITELDDMDCILQKYIELIKKREEELDKNENK